MSNSSVQTMTFDYTIKWFKLVARRQPFNLFRGVFLQFYQLFLVYSHFFELSAVSSHARIII